MGNTLEIPIENTIGNTLENPMENTMKNTMGNTLEKPIITQGGCANMEYVTRTTNTVTMNTDCAYLRDVIQDNTDTSLYDNLGIPKTS